jgi:hypothetical protein
LPLALILRVFAQVRAAIALIAYGCFITLTGGTIARRKRNSTVLACAERRIESLQAINSALDFGNGLTLAAYTSLIQALRSKLAAYNTALSAIDKLNDDVDMIEQAVLEMSEKMLMAVGSRYGRSSQEYEMAGGSRRKRNRRSSTAAPSTDPSPSATTSTTNGSTADTAPTTAS